MEPSTLLRCPKMEECPSPVTKLVPKWELDIVMLSAHMTLNGSMEKPICLTGNPAMMTPTRELEDMEPAVMKWTFGKPILWPRLTLLILVILMANSDATELNVGMDPTDTEVFVTRTDVTLIPSDWV
jgi:hypothetical protein